MTIWLAFFLLTPIFFLRELVDYTSGDSDRTLGYGIFLGLGMMISEALRSAFAHQYWMFATTIGTNLRTLMYAVVYRKAIELRDLGGYSVGELSNLCSNDGQRFYDASTMVFFIYTSFVMTVVVVVASALFVGPFAVLGCGIYILFIPLQVLFWAARSGARRFLGWNRCAARRGAARADAQRFLRRLLDAALTCALLTLPTERRRQGGRQASAPRRHDHRQARAHDE